MSNLTTETWISDRGKMDQTKEMGT